MEPTGDGRAIMETSRARQLIQGEPDASSFPSGGLRATFEARGYTAWDPTSPCLHQGRGPVHPHRVHAPTPARRWTRRPRCCAPARPSTARPCACSSSSARTIKSVTTTVGPEQEYFLIDEEDYAARPDLHHVRPHAVWLPSRPRARSWRSTTSAPSAPRVNEFMKELDDELWKLGVPAKTKHNEVAPCQHELAPIFDERQRRHRPQPAHDGEDEEGRLPPRPRLPAAREALCRRQRLGQAQQLVHLGTTRQEPARPRPTRPRTTCSSSLFLSSVIEAVDDYQDLHARKRCLGRQRPPSGRQRGSSGDRLHLPGRRACRRRGRPHQ